jgi:hypothetical protein
LVIFDLPLSLEHDRNPAEAFGQQTPEQQPVPPLETENANYNTKGGNPRLSLTGVLHRFCGKVCANPLIRARNLINPGIIERFAEKLC